MCTHTHTHACTYFCRARSNGTLPSPTSLKGYLNEPWLTEGWQKSVRATVLHKTHTHTTADILYNRQTLLFYPQSFVPFLCVAVSFCLSFFQTLPPPHVFHLTFTIMVENKAAKERNGNLHSPSFPFYFISCCPLWLSNDELNIKTASCTIANASDGTVAPLCACTEGFYARKKDLCLKHIQERWRWWREEKEVTRLGNEKGSKSESIQPPLGVLWTPVFVLFFAISWVIFFLNLSPLHHSLTASSLPRIGCCNTFSVSHNLSSIFSSVRFHSDSKP